MLPFVKRMQKSGQTMSHTLHVILFPPDFTFHTLPFTLYIPCSTLHTLDSTLSTPHSTLYTSHSPHSPHSPDSPHSPHPPHSAHSPHSPHSRHSPLHTLHFALYTLHSPLDTPHSTLYSPHSTQDSLAKKQEPFATHSGKHLLNNESVLSRFAVFLRTTKYVFLKQKVLLPALKPPIVCIYLLFIWDKVVVSRCQQTYKEVCVVTAPLTKKRKIKCFGNYLDRAMFRLVWKTFFCFAFWCCLISRINPDQSI